MGFEQWYFEIPIVTRCYLTASVLTTAGSGTHALSNCLAMLTKTNERHVEILCAACYFDIISPFSLYLNYRLIFEKYEFWRILTNFFFFGMPSLDFVFHMYFLVRYCRLLEEVCNRCATLLCLQVPHHGGMRPRSRTWRRGFWALNLSCREVMYMLLRGSHVTRCDPHCTFR